MKKLIYGNTDEDADWIKSLPGHKNEAAIHDALAKKKKGKGKKKSKPKEEEGISHGH